MYKPQDSHHDVAAVPDQIILADGFDFFQELFRTVSTFSTACVVLDKWRSDKRAWRLPIHSRSRRAGIDIWLVVWYNGYCKH